MTAITTAARLLRVAADELKNAHTLGGDWGNEHEALDAYNEHMATATTLEHMARQCLAQIEEPAGAAPAAVARWGCEDRSAWFALAMGAAASLEDAANCLRDKDAQKAAMGAATHVRESCNKLWWAAPALEAPAHQCCNSWFLSLPEGRQAVLRENQWMLADAAYQAGRESRSALEAPAAPADPSRIVADALIRLDAIYREEADCDEPPQRPDWLVNALHLAAAAPQAPAAPVHSKTYSDGTVATGSGDLPADSPQQQVLCTLLDTIEAMLGGANGPTIQIRAALLAAPAAPAVDADPLGLRDVGEAFMQAIERNSDALKAVGWLGPMDCPSEIVVDLLNLLEEANTTSALGEWVATLEVDSGGGLDYETVPPCTLPPGCYPLYRAAQAAAKGAA